MSQGAFLRYARVWWLLRRRRRFSRLCCCVEGGVSFPVFVPPCLPGV